MDLLELLRKGGMDGDVDFLREALRVLVEGIMPQEVYHPHFPYQPYKTTYHNTYEQLKGNKRKGIAPLAWDIPDEHDPEDLGSAFEVANSGGVPLGVLYRDESRLPFEARIEEIGRSAKSKTVEQMIEAYAV